MENTIIERVVVEPVQKFIEILIHFLPNLFTAVLILLVGIVIGWLIKFVSVKVLGIFKVDELAERAGMKALIEKGGIRGTASQLIGKSFAWAVILAFFLMSLRSINILAVDRLFEQFFLYLPSVVVAVVILAFGFMLGNFLGRAALITAVNAGLRTAGMIGRLVRLTIYIFAVSIALEQLGIGKETVVIAFAITAGGIVFSLALAFGLGGKDLAKEYLEKKIRGGDEESDDINHL